MCLLADAQPSDEMIDQCTEEMRQRGWTAGEMATCTPQGHTWVVYGYHGKAHVSAWGGERLETWLKALQMAEKEGEFGIRDSGHGSRRTGHTEHGEHEADMRSEIGSRNFVVAASDLLRPPTSEF